MTLERSFGPGGPGGHPPEGPAPRTAMAVLQGQAAHLEPHLRRLVLGAEALGAPAPWISDLAPALEAWLAAEAPPGAGALRLCLDPTQGRLWSRLEPFPGTPRTWRLACLPHPMAACQGDPRLPHKGLMGPWSDRILNKARGLGGEDALLLWSDGTVAETSISAVALELGGQLLVPPPRGRVASLAERLDLPGWAQARGLTIVSVPYGVEAAAQGRLWCLNAVRGCWPAQLL